MAPLHSTAGLPSARPSTRPHIVSRPPQHRCFFYRTRSGLLNGAVCHPGHGPALWRCKHWPGPGAIPPDHDSADSGSSPAVEECSPDNTPNTDRPDAGGPNPSRMQSSSSSRPRRPLRPPSPPRHPFMDFEPPPAGPRTGPLERALGLMVATGGVYGTAAVAMGWLAHIEPFGNFHYDRHDILIAALIFLPVYLADVLILVPDWETEGGAEKLMRPDTPIVPVFRPQPSPSAPNSKISTAPPTTLPATNSPATADTQSTAPFDPNPLRPQTQDPISPPSLTPGLPQVPTSSSPRPASSWGLSPLPERLPSWTFVDALRIALQRTQDSYFQINVGSSLPDYLELIVIVVGVLGQEMLYRGVVFTMLSGWLRDRYYEAGADDFVQVAPSFSLSMADLGKWSAVALFALAGAIAVARKMVDASRRNRLLIIPITGKGKEAAGAKYSKESSTAKRLLHVGPRISQTMALSQLIKGGRDTMESIAACTSFVVTGNLAATYAATVLSEVSFSYMQRQGVRRYKRKSNRYYHKLVHAVARARKSADEQAAATIGSTASTSEPGDEATPPITSTSSSSPPLDPPMPPRNSSPRDPSNPPTPPPPSKSAFTSLPTPPSSSTPLMLSSLPTDSQSSPRGISYPPGQALQEPGASTSGWDVPPTSVGAINRMENPVDASINNTEVPIAGSPLAGCSRARPNGSLGPAGARLQDGNAAEAQLD